VKVIFAVPSLHGPTEPFKEALERSIHPVMEAGLEEGLVEERGNPYISQARSTMLRKALDAHADAIVFLDYDLSWGTNDLLKLVQTPGDVVAGTYRFKTDEEEDYMGSVFTHENGTPVCREDGCIKAKTVPAGFLKVTKEAVDRFMKKYPELIYGTRYNPSVDLFNHGARNGIWWGEDYSFSQNYIEAGGELWIVPDLDITHWRDDTPYPGNYHRWLLRQPGGSDYKGA
jgi:hypothetical protein